MCTLADLARLQAKLRELSLLVDDIVAQDSAAVVPPSQATTPPSVSSRPPLPRPRSLPLLTPPPPLQRALPLPNPLPALLLPRDDENFAVCTKVDTSPVSRSTSPKTLASSAGSNVGVSTAIMRCNNITVRDKACAAPSTSSLLPASTPLSFSASSLDNGVPPARHLGFTTPRDAQ